MTGKGKRGIVTLSKVHNGASAAGTVQARRRIGNRVQFPNGTATVSAEAAPGRKPAIEAIRFEKAAGRAEDAQVRRPACRQDDLFVPRATERACSQKNGCGSFFGCRSFLPRPRSSPNRSPPPDVQPSSRRDARNPPSPSGFRASCRFIGNGAGGTAAVRSRGAPPAGACRSPPTWRCAPRPGSRPGPGGRRGSQRCRCRPAGPPPAGR